MQSTATVTPAGTDRDVCRELADKCISFMETGQVPDALFAADLFLDFTMPLWRLQAGNVEDAVGIRRAGHPSPGRVPRSRYDRTEKGFVLEVEETWEQDGDSWYCRELLRADVVDGLISELSVYCTGDWDSARVAEHGSTVPLIRP
jgi:hypothetical protein